MKKIIKSEMLLVLCWTIIFLVLANYLCAIQFQYNDNQKKSFQIIYDDSAEIEMINNDMVRAYEQLANSKYDFLEYSEQDLEYLGKYDMETKFVDGGEEAVNQKINDYVLSPLKAVGIGRDTFEHFNVQKKISEGRGFLKKDFVFENNQIMPLILGNQYKKYMKLGDEFDFLFLGEIQLKGKVVGFFDKKQKIDEISIDLDDIIVYPLQNVRDLSATKSDFVTRLYKIKIEGKFEYNSAKQYYKEVSLVEKISNSNKLPLLHTEDINLVPEDEKYKMSVQTARVLLGFGYLLLAISCIFFWCNVFCNEKKVFVVNTIKKILFLVIFNVIAYTFLFHLVLYVCNNETLCNNIMRQKAVANVTIGVNMIVSLVIALIIRRIRNGNLRSN